MIHVLPVRLLDTAQGRLVEWCQTDGRRLRQSFYRDDIHYLRLAARQQGRLAETDIETGSEELMVPGLRKRNGQMRSFFMFLDVGPPYSLRCWRRFRNMS